MKRRAVLAVVVVVVAAGLYGWRVASVGHTDGGLRPEARPAPSTTVAADTRTVGRGRSVVDIPMSWGTNKTKCGTALADTVSFYAAVQRLCLITDKGFSVVEIEPYLADRYVEEVTDSYHRKTFANAADDARIVIRSKDRAVFDKIVASYHRLGPNWTTVPELFIGHSGGTPGFDGLPGGTEWQRRLERFGLKAAGEIVEPVHPTGGPPTAAPEIGTVIRKGSTVTITQGH